MGEKRAEFRTSMSTQQCGAAFKSGIEEGRGTSARLGGIAAKLMGGESLSWYTPQDDSVFASLNDDPPAFTVGVGVPKAQGAHANGTNLEMYVWDRAAHRDVTLWAHHSLTGASHATKLIDVVRSRIKSGSGEIGAAIRDPQAHPITTDLPLRSDATIDVATQFFADELKNVASASVLGRDQTSDEKALLSPLGETTRLNNSRAMERCQELVDEAMSIAAEISGWCLVDGVRLPKSWLKSYEDLANLDHGCPAIVALIERSQHSLASGLESAPAASPLEASEIEYDLADWTAIEFTRITAELDREGASWYLDDGALVVDARFESMADDLIERITGDKPM
mgnify:CR=1 FL=1